MRSEKSIILFFSYSAAAQARFKNWCGGDVTRNRELASLLINRTLNTLRRSGLPVCHYHEEMQRGNTFGERLSAAFRDLFEQGYDSVIAVGNDTPGLKQVDWSCVTSLLQNGRAVVGPDYRGGVYLLGIRRKHWEQGALENIHWNSGRVFEDLRDALGAPYALQIYRDLNDARDITAYIRETPDDDLLVRCIRSGSPVSITRYHCIPMLPAGTVSRRGPPKEWHISA